ncbi:MAG: biotin-dependent carboxyltransferase family protein [Ilumatobacteraceae bacterium]
MRLDEGPRGSGAERVPTLEVIELGIATTVQDRGRVGLAALGVGRSGWVYEAHAQAANRAVGNSASAPVIETVGGLVLRANAPCVIAATGWVAPRAMRVNDIVEIGTRPDGLWTYVAVTGGIHGDAMLGSLSEDTLAGLCPLPVVAGGVYGIGDASTAAAADIVAPPQRMSDRLHVHPGPQSARFSVASAQLASATLTVVASSRVGIRLGGADIGSVTWDQMPSQPLIPGAIQIPPDGQPIVMGPDHPTTGGYPVIGVLGRDDLSDLADRPPGASVQMRPAASEVAPDGVVG